MKQLTLPSYQELKARLPLLPIQRHFIEQSRQTVRSILNGTDHRLLLIVGPCSIHDPLAAKEFAKRFLHLSQAVADDFYLVMRVYCEKPRTAWGWKGFLYDPLLDGSHDMHMGLEGTRQLLLELADMQVPTATEFLDPLTAPYYEDLVTWGSIGARTSSSQPHRQLASGLSLPIGFKNGLAGNISAAVTGVQAASKPHVHVAMSQEGHPMIAHTKGNPDTHIVLRGGEGQPNYDPPFVAEALERLKRAQLPLRLVIDCSHQNSGKQYERQVEVFQSVIHQVVAGNSYIRGLMLESHLFAGNQLLTAERVDNLQFGISITDACLDWHSTAQLIQWGFQALQQHRFLPGKLQPCELQREELVR